MIVTKSSVNIARSIKYVVSGLHRSKGMKLQIRVIQLEAGVEVSSKAVVKFLENE